MSAIVRLVGHRAIGNVVQNNMFQHVRALQIQLLPRNDTPTRLNEHDTANMKRGRPMSPHLTIYKTQLTSFLSISHRITGVGLTAYIYMLAAGPLFWKDYNSFITAISGMPTVCHLALKFVIAFPLAYHAANGVRHLLWDSGKNFQLKEVYSSGYAMVAGSLILTAILMAI